MMTGSAELTALREFLEQVHHFRKNVPNQNFILRLEVSGLKDEKAK
jgi:hypothetical protein